MRELSEVARCAKAIRTELKKLFPETKFSVTSESFSMGNAVRINWQDGITEAALKDLLDKYRDGDFDGMTDSYDYRPSNNLPRAKYITTSRNISEIYYKQAYDYIKSYYNFDFPDKMEESNEVLFKQTGAWTGRNLAYRLLHKTDLTQGLSLTNLKGAI